MKEFKGTKGKWIFNENEMKIKGSGDIEGLIVIANVSPKMDFSRGMTIQTANAKLIAAAPEMLEMLQKIVLMTETCQGTFEDFGERYNIEIQKLIQKSIE